MCSGRNVHGNPAQEISTLIINRKVCEIGSPEQRRNYPFQDQRRGTPMVKAELAFGEEPLRGGVAGILHNAGRWMADVSQPSPGHTQTPNRVRSHIGPTSETL